MQKKGKQFSSSVQQLTFNSHETDLCASNRKELDCNNNYILELFNREIIHIKTTNVEFKTEGICEEGGPFPSH